MSRQTTNLMLTDATERLAAPQSLQELFHQHEEGYPLPSSRKLEEIVELARATLFPGYFGQSQVNIHTIKYQIGVNVERLYHLLCEQVLAGLGFVGTADADNATILGRITIGSGCVVGANVWVTHDMKPNSKKYRQENNDIFDLEFNNGTGI